ncbi:MAG: helix-turn-helix transcriptional regulator [Clostridia bacterium]|nr:helix-turn-helix transcriptional regulator [Clostridia bacterium]
MNQEKIGVFIANCRKEKKLTQEQLAEKLGVSSKSVSRWENGKTMPDYSLLKDLCEILGININELLSGERIKKEEIQIHTIENLDSILKEYYKMKKQKDFFKFFTILISMTLLCVLIVIMIYVAMLLGGIFIIGLGFNDKYDITTDITKYQEVIGKNAKGQYESKWGVSEEIFPSEISDKNVSDFKMVYYDPWDKQFLSYLVVNYNEKEYEKEVKRLNDYGIEDYVGYYGVTGFENYKLLAMESDPYYGFIYAITDGKEKIIYVEIIFCNNYMDIKYAEQIPNEYLPDNFDAKIDNKYNYKDI